MDATALIVAGPAIQIHAAAAVLAIILGGLVLLMPKGTRVHKAMGRTWVGLMLVVAFSSFFITEFRMFGPYSLIHALSLLTIFTVFDAIRKIRKGDVKGHQREMVTLYGLALILTGAFTLLPGRRMHAVLFADGGQTAAIVATLAAVLVGTIVIARMRIAAGAKG